VFLEIGSTGVVLAAAARIRYKIRHKRKTSNLIPKVGPWEWLLVHNHALGW
jgi:hypothetical protein